MAKKHNFTYQLVVMAFLVALEIILTRFLSIQLPIARIGFGLTQAITAHARELTPERSRELHEISGQLMNRVRLNA